MPPKADPYADVKCSPPRKLPPIEALDRREPPANLERAVKLVHVGLRRVAVVARNVRDAKGDQVGTFQRLSFALGDDRRPSLSARTIAALVNEFAESFARDRDHLVNFRIDLQWVEDGGKSQEKQVRFTVDPSRLSDGDDDEDDLEEDDEDDDDGDVDEEEAEDEGEDDDNDDPEAEADYDDEPVERASRPRPRALPRPRDAADAYVDRSLMGPIEQPVQIHPVVAQAQSMGLQPDLSGGVPLQMNAMFVLQVIERQTANVARIWADQARQQRRDRRLMRREFTSGAREMRRMASMMISESREQRDTAQRLAADLGAQLIEITSLNREQHENYQKIAAHSWKAFRHSMEQEATMASTLMRYERALFDERLANAERNVEVEPSQWPGLLGGIAGKAIPMALGFMANIQKKRGNTDLYEMFRDMANTMTAQSRAEVDEDEDEDDEDESDENLAGRVVDTDATETPRAQPAYANPSPTRDGARALLETIDEEQSKELLRALPEGVWETFEKITVAQTESNARALSTRLETMLRKDVTTVTGIMQILRPDQTRALMDLGRAATERKRVPPRPRAPASATG
jgi:hypothetical protein